MLIATAQEMRNVDRNAIRKLGIPGIVLMENAAAAVMSGMENRFRGLDNVRVGIVCGKGNNGGDGIALARRLRIRGVPVRVALLAAFRSVAGDAKINLDVLRHMDVEIVENANARKLADLISWSDVLVDAILGTGLSSLLTGTFKRSVQMMNASSKSIVSIDIPTGINSDNGSVMGAAIKADLTVTLALLKRGLVLHPGAAHAGSVRVADIGIPAQAYDDTGIKLQSIDADLLSGMITDRHEAAHKGDFGHALIIGGSPGKAGAAVLAAKGALRSGAGLVSVAVPNSLVPIIQSQTAEAMCIPSAESIDSTFSIAAEAEVVNSLNSFSAAVIGPGISTQTETVQFVRNVVLGAKKPLVVDADALNAIARGTEVLLRVKAPLIFTPHPGEMSRLIGKSVAEIQLNRIEIASAFAKKFRVVLVLKGAGTVVALPDGSAFVNSTGNPGMATGGTGDVLSGMIGGLLAQGLSASDAACLGVYLHGAAGDLAAEAKGEASMIAGDLIDMISSAMKNLTETTERTA
jgi:hydroxyethylthiazole kinase-like uncharacterized protein yjeF